jgi:hypothetical protein
VTSASFAASGIIAAATATHATMTTNFVLRPVTKRASAATRAS